MALLRLQQGEVDILGDGIPPAQFLRGEGRSRAMGQNRGGRPAPHRLRDDERQRPAVRRRRACARPSTWRSTRTASSQIINNRAVPANQPLPPSMPGYAKDYAGYAYDPGGRKALLAEAGSRRRLRDRALRLQHRPEPAHRPGDPAGSGADRHQGARSSRWRRPTSSRRAATAGAPMIWSGGMAWIADFPDPSNFYGPILGCGGAVQGGWNWSWYCNEELDAKARRGRRDRRPGAGGGARGAVGRDLRRRSWRTRPGRRSSTSSASPCIRRGWAAPDALYVDPVHIPVALRLRVRDRCAVSTATRSTAAHHHFGWDNVVPAGRDGGARATTLRFECLDAGAATSGPTAPSPTSPRSTSREVNPVTGPVYVEGAEPGDALKVTIGDFVPSGFGWTANIPGFGLLADQFPEPALHALVLRPGGAAPALFGPGARVPLKPFAGTIGLAPAEPGLHSVVPPRRVGGNLDIRDLAAGAVLYLPVEVRGRAVLGRRHPCGAGRRRGLRHRDREPDGRQR